MVSMMVSMVMGDGEHVEEHHGASIMVMVSIMVSIEHAEHGEH